MEEAEAVFREILQVDVQRAWGKFLTEIQEKRIMDTLARFAISYLKYPGGNWFAKTEDRLSSKFEQEIFHLLLQEDFNRTDSLLMARRIGEDATRIYGRVMHLAYNGIRNNTDSMDVQDDDEINSISTLTASSSDYQKMGDVEDGGMEDGDMEDGDMEVRDGEGDDDDRYGDLIIDNPDAVPEQLTPVPDDPNDRESTLVEDSGAD
ncbi:hypothetical protein diail_1929 [Diaporthe ilicicola]|nr:hypothetical protein diail_1929 [Diaporthe ilicicola]